MKTAAFIAVALAALAQAQTRADIPACALPCLDDAVKANTKCSTTDYACICKDFSAVQTAATSCVISKCGADVALNKVLPATQALCAANPGSGSSAPPGTTPAQQTSSSAADTSAAETSSAAHTTAAPTSAAPTTAV
ncbi:extracellular membrane, cfem domain-containing, partial [Trichoderma arundinaceum]